LEQRKRIPEKKKKIFRLRTNLKNQFVGLSRKKNESILYQWDRVPQSLRIFAWDHGNDAPQSWAGVGVEGEKQKRNIY